MATTITTRAGKGSALTHAEMDGNLTALRDTADGAAAAGSAATAHAASTSNPHSVTKAQVGLGSVDNTSDAAKPVSTAQAAAIAAAVTAHEQAADPHPAYLTQAEAGALYSPTGAYVKPADGIQRQDLDHTIRGQLDLADTSLQPGAQLTQAVVNSTTAAGATLMTGADAAAQRTALGLGTAATTESTAYATAAQGAKADAALPATADAIADVLEAAVNGAPADLARIQASVSGDRAALNATQQAQQAAGATTALLSVDKSALLDPGGGPAIDIKRYKIVGTLAQVIAVTGAAGDEAFVTDVGSGVVVGWTAAGWSVVGRQVIHRDHTLSYGAASTTETVVKQTALPIGIASICTGFTVYAGWQKSGIATAASNARVRAGTLGTAGDTSILSNGSLTAGNRSTSQYRDFVFVSPSVITPIGRIATDNPDWSGTGTAAAYPANTTIGDTSTVPVYLSVTMQMAAVGDQPGAYTLIVELFR